MFVIYLYLKVSSVILSVGFCACGGRPGPGFGEVPAPGISARVFGVRPYSDRAGAPGGRVGRARGMDR